MTNMLEKVFVSKQLGFELTSFIDKQNNVFFVGKDVAKILGYKDTDQAIRKHVDNEDKFKGAVETTGSSKKYLPVETTGSSKRGRPPIIINESGFYSLVLSSKLETAKEFKRWVISEVLPCIRKYGFYKTFDPKIKQRVIVDGKKYYKHPVFTNYAANKHGEVINVKNEKKRSMSTNNSGYLFFSIYHNELEKPKIYTQHRFVFEVLAGPIPRCFEIDHINNDKTDNRIKNLQLVTHKKNMQKRYSSKK